MFRLKKDYEMKSGFPGKYWRDFDEKLNTEIEHFVHQNIYEDMSWETFEQSPEFQSIEEEKKRWLFIDEFCRE